MLSSPLKQGHQAMAIDHPDSVKRQKDESDQGHSAYWHLKVKLQAHKGLAHKGLARKGLHKGKRNRDELSPQLCPDCKLLSKRHVALSKEKVTKLWGHLLHRMAYTVCTQTYTHHSSLARHGHRTIFLKSPQSELNVRKLHFSLHL